ncbi:polysaccharide deacetylase family protein [Aurantimonas sp. VKM B-3413]|uniref:polysaccharide deacetylase family protein n=1 Tax=Aurantimonas sp. VKM B-3413 TaxID=2779401 RepID=UPI001E3AACE2|nr:polysaccharide deacetylase family protein [Aurantimonas sp. VKM B-3413]MCB8836734.1 polysaccharide deacetylase family protein [Aurantimonas sp. VKM B-3413]
MIEADELERELGLWAAAGRQVEVWWRDDDADRPGGQLDRLLAAAARHGVPLAVAAVPAALDERLADVLADPLVAVLQHGFAHRNHAAPGGRAVECGGDRTVDAVMAELAAGRARLAEVFGASFLPVMVPPWNRIEPAVADALPAAGYRGLSVFGPSDPHRRPTGLREVNAHLDLLTWKGGARFAGAAKLIRLAAERLEARRLAGAGPAEPFGILTHHLDHDAETWAFLEAILSRLAGHPAVRFLSAGDLFRSPAGAGDGVVAR